MVKLWPPVSLSILAQIRWIVLSLSPHRLTEISGIGRKKAEAIGMSYAELSDMRELMVYLESHGVSANYAPKLQAQYGATAMKRIQENPYSLASDITGIGFRTADKIAWRPDGRRL